MCTRTTRVCPPAPTALAAELAARARAAEAGEREYGDDDEEEAEDGVHQEPFRVVEEVARIAVVRTRLERRNDGRHGELRTAAATAAPLGAPRSCTHSLFVSNHGRSFRTNAAGATLRRLHSTWRRHCPRTSLLTSLETVGALVPVLEISRPAHTWRAAAIRKLPTSCRRAEAKGADVKSLERDQGLVCGPLWWARKRGWKGRNG